MYDFGTQRLLVLFKMVRDLEILILLETLNND